MYSDLLAVPTESIYFTWLLRNVFTSSENQIPIKLAICFENMLVSFGNISVSDKRTYDLGIIIRATAIQRIKSKLSKSSTSANGVPSTLTSMLIGTLSGCCGKFASCTNNEDLSTALSFIGLLEIANYLMSSRDTRKIIKRFNPNRAGVASAWPAAIVYTSRREEVDSADWEIQFFFALAL